MFRCPIEWSKTATANTQLDWVDHVIALESWLEAHVGQRGTHWDWFNDTEFGQLGFAREQDWLWFTLRWS